MEDKEYLKFLSESFKNKLDEKDDIEQKERIFFIFVIILMLFSMFFNTLAPLLTLGLIMTFDVLYIRNR